jgi:NitT/TauT family transport system ATP-binding protein
MKNYSGSQNVLELRNINQSYKDKKGETFTLFQDLNICVEDIPDKGQFIVLMGESGCGKSTVLRYLTGLQKPDSGEILLYDKSLTPKDTIPMVFQNPSSLEWYSVLDNVALPLVLRGIGWKQAREQSMDIIKVMNLEKHMNKYAKYPLLSGGQLQRVAIARSLVANPTMIVMDEPFSALDSLNRRKMQDFMQNLFESKEAENLNPTILLVTHDAREAAYLADEIFIMGSNPGRVKNHLKVNYSNRTDLKKQPEYLDLVSYIEQLVEN